jgi:surface antigen
VDTAPAREDEVRGGGDGQEVPGYGEPDQSHVLEVARSLLTYRYVRVGRGGGFRLDCSGYVRAVHLSLGLDLFVPRTDDTASRPTHVGGVGLILWYNQHHGTFWPRSGPPEAYAVEPRPGDIVYFHDTHDRNKNRRFDDPFTHVGLVESVDADGTVTFLHAAGHIVKREKMNLRHPRKTRDEAGNIINHALRVRKRWEKPGDPHLAAELFAGYGRLQRPSHLPAFTEERAISVLPTGKQYARGVRKPGRGKRRDREPADRVARTSKNGKAKKTGKAAKKTHTSSKRGNARTR